MPTNLEKAKTLVSTARDLIEQALAGLPDDAEFDGASVEEFDSDLGDILHKIRGWQCVCEDMGVV